VRTSKSSQVKSSPAHSLPCCASGAHSIGFRMVFCCLCIDLTCVQVLYEPASVEASDHSPHHRPHRPWQTPHAPSPPSCRSPRARTTARALLASSASIPITVSRCIVVSLYLVVSRCIVVSLYLRVSRRPVVSLCRCISCVLLYRCIVVYLLVSRCPVVSLCRCISPSRCIVVSLYNVRPT
jgi:hypothetical protein